MKAEANGIKTEWLVAACGISNNALWYVVESKLTQATLKMITPKILPPEVDGKEAPYRYKAYGDGEFKFCYCRWRIPSFWAEVPAADISKFVRQQNQAMNVMVSEHDGSERPAQFNIKNRMKDRGDYKNGKSTGMIVFQVEIEEPLWVPLVEECLGKLRLGLNGELPLEGREIKEAVEKYLYGDDKEMKEAATEAVMVAERAETAQIAADVADAAEMADHNLQMDTDNVAVEAMAKPAGNLSDSNK